MLYLVQFNLERHDYPGRHSETLETRLVEADDERGVIRKLDDYYEKLSDPYAVTYYVRTVECHPVIS